MTFRLVAAVRGREIRLPLVPGEQTLGSLPECDLTLPHATVSRRHATVRVDGSTVVVRDLDSRNGLRRGYQRLDEVRLQPGDELYIGRVRVRLEEVPEDDLEAAVVFATGPAASAGLPPQPQLRLTTRDSGPGEEFVRIRLPVLLDRLVAAPSPLAFAQLVGEAIFASFPCARVVIVDDRNEDEGYVFRAQRDCRDPSSVRTVTSHGGGLRLEVDLLDHPATETLVPLIDVGGRLLELARALDRPADRHTQPAEHPLVPEPPSIVPEVQELYAAAARVAQGNVSVLILGESGTGKEVLASFLHRASPRHAGPFLTLNCASLPQDLLESELFGIEKGVATGVEARPGKFELADRGTLLLDEVGDMAPGTQAKILRVLQSGESFRLGARAPRRVDVRIVAATNRDLRKMLAEGTFREDLYHRIATWVVEVPPLRRRLADIPNLASWFLARESERHARRIRGISKAAMDALQAFSWPGNIRQLENEMARAVLFLEDGELLDTARLGPEIQGHQIRGGTLADALNRAERREIAVALERAHHDIDRAAATLGISRATLYRRLKTLRLRVVPENPTDRADQ